MSFTKFSSPFSLNRSPLAKAALPQSHEVLRRRVSLIGRLFQSNEPRDPIYQPPPLHPQSTRKLHDDEPVSLRANATESMTNTILISMRPEELHSVTSTPEDEDIGSKDEVTAYDDPESDVADPRLYEALKTIRECIVKIQTIKAEVAAGCIPVYARTESTSL
ncbi:hypothetical protein ACHHYP_04367 [Achlya hypogyna]|uniref:Uncharacterized protein n=1 Tax=Achlya hypogyna TaxID=1202772 RepID=A0A1V9Z1V3_ACHHY|nr:hypothetical protein ACHHYP_04367 [Achlya hypogyna]